MYGAHRVCVARRSVETSPTTDVHGSIEDHDEKPDSGHARERPAVAGDSGERFDFRAECHVYPSSCDVGVESGAVRPDCDHDLLARPASNGREALADSQLHAAGKPAQRGLLRSELFMSELKLRPPEQGNCVTTQFPSRALVVGYFENDAGIFSSWLCGILPTCQSGLSRKSGPKI